MSKARELTLEPLGSVLIGVGGAFQFAKISKMHRLPIMANTNFVLASVFVPRNALVAGCAVLVGAGIRLLLSSSGYSQISASIIEAIVVMMITSPWVSRFEAKNLSMHANLRAISSIWRPDHIPSFRGFFPKRSPLPLGEPFVIFGINNGKESFVERNKAVRLFGWGHGRSLGGWACPAFAAPDPFILPLEAA